MLSPFGVTLVDETDVAFSLIMNSSILVSSKADAEMSNLSSHLQGIMIVFRYLFPLNAFGAISCTVAGIS